MNIKSLLCSMVLLIISFFDFSHSARGQTSNPPNTITRNTGYVRVDQNGDIRIQPRVGFGVAMPSTCTGAPVSQPGEARWCYDSATGAVRISTNGGVYLNWTNPGSAPGTVSSVNLALPASLFSITGSPVTTSGTLTGALNSQPANTVFAAPTTGGVPSFISLTPSHIPALDTSQLATGILPVARGGTGNGGAYTNGDLLYFGTTAFNRLPGNISATRKFLRTVGDGVFTTAPVWDTIANTDIVGTMAVSQGGTGLTSLGAANASLKVNAAGSGFSFGALSAGTNISITYDGSGNPTIAGVNSTVSPLWNNLAAPSANLALNMGAFTSRWNYGNGLFRFWDGQGRVGINTTAPTASYHTLGGGLRVQALATPAAPTVTPNTTGTTSYSYFIVANDVSGNKNLASAAGTTTTGAATPNNTITWSAVPGAVSYDVLKGTTSTLLLNTTATIATDTNQITSAYSAPARNTTADANIDGQIPTLNTQTLNTQIVNFSIKSLSIKSRNLTINICVCRRVARGR